MIELVLASGNPGKLAELEELLAGLPLRLRSMRDFGIAEPAETGLSFVENALIKARHAARLSGLPALADDSGLLVDALHGQPGLHTADYAGHKAPAAANIAKLLAALEGVPEQARQARFVAVVVLLRHTEDPLPLIAEGEWRGRILAQPRGQDGFGYDPIFEDPALGLSAAEMAPAVKDARSHRGLALAALRSRLLDHLGG